MQNRLFFHLVIKKGDGKIEQLPTRKPTRLAPQAGLPAERVRKFFADKEAIFREALPSPFALVVTDPLGTVIHVLEHPAGGRSHLGTVASVGVNLTEGPGRILPLEAAVHRQADVWLSGREPWFPGQSGWSCAVVALRETNRSVFAYMSLFAPERNLTEDMFPYVRALALVMESELVAGRTHWTDFADFMAAQLEKFNLTPRERQVAALWMMDYDYKQIGRAIGISENTVRVITRRINLKLNVNSKASFILRVLGAI